MKQPEALRLADQLSSPYAMDYEDAMQAAAELRRLHEQNERLIRIIDSRPAINAGLPQTYIDWSQSLYLVDYHTGAEQTND